MAHLLCGLKKDACSTFTLSPCLDRTGCHLDHLNILQNTQGLGSSRTLLLLKDAEINTNSVLKKSPNLT